MPDVSDHDQIEKITRSLAYMLRHRPDEFDLEVDAHGFAAIGEVVRALNERIGEPVEEADVLDAIDSGDRPRYQIDGDRIRALYGHSIPVEPGPDTQPPEYLYLGIPTRDVDRAQRHGLRARRRSFLHLALTAADAAETGRRAAREYTVLRIHALDAWEEGVNFYDRTALWLADEVPAEMVEIGDAYTDGVDPQRRRTGGDDDRGDRRDGRRGGSRRGRDDRDRDRDGHRDRDDRDRDDRDAPRGRRREREERPSRDERPARDDRDERPARGARDERPRRSERDERPRREERDERPARSERDERPRREERDERPRRDDRDERPARGERDERPRRSERDERPRRSEREERPARTERPRRDTPAPAPAASKPAASKSAASKPASAGPGFGLGVFEAPEPKRAKEPREEPAREPRRERRPEPAPKREPRPAPKDDGPGFGAGV